MQTQRSRVIQNKKEKPVVQASFAEILNSQPFSFVRTSVSQLTRKSKGIEYATDEGDAVSWLEKHVVKWELLAEEDQRLGVTIAMDKGQGVMEAKRVLEHPAQEKVAQERRQSKLKASRPDFTEYDGAFRTDLANAIFSVMHEAYVSGNTNVTVAGEYTQDEIDEAINSFSSYIKRGEDLTEFITKVHWFGGEDKAALGKGRVGDTLDTRGIQANFIAFWDGFPVNVHVNITD
ncbi:hypothetical protein [Parabacteroides pacaensis]|uniref:hypothetical protein n=1 Tax=Parabacteroides pacaensis TaxID=2086575 RepID=UPI00131DB800|nr:hypothetical protein [Parabacteroides pacaensis]